MKLIREDIDRIATEYLNDTESTFEMEDVIELAIKALKLEEAIEDIKAEIESYSSRPFNEFNQHDESAFDRGLLRAYLIIEKHIGAEEWK